MNRDRAERATDPNRALPGARSIVTVAAPYARRQHLSALTAPTARTAPSDGPSGDEPRGKVARYAWGRDYHHVLLQRTAGLIEALRERYGHRDARKGMVDTARVVDRAIAHRAGVGWYGKNTCIINQQLGSWIFLGVILTSLEMQPDLPAPDRCGACTRCIEACPTDALLAPCRLDSNKCISYLTIEKRGEISEEIQEGMGRHVFGCDICQDVCPWNGRAPVTADADYYPKAYAPALGELSLLSEEEFRALFRNSPVWRAKYAGFLQNTALAMGNSRQSAMREPLERLAQHPDETVAATARRVLERLAGG